MPIHLLRLLRIGPVRSRKWFLGFWTRGDDMTDTLPWSTDGCFFATVYQMAMRVNALSLGAKSYSHFLVEPRLLSTG